ncbi:MBL fold metallo-hydrolase [Spirulina sp. CS-785/01]|uniref:MBL fold metallo-hydrolase n=1 Tax=Spirulina sp. CS-785/01 TaxID=3021716 RepID=UPI00232C4EC1|nr:MBL fold metallo-hydrolase [Spirulina sp. CS-785/01]MDB9311523.1 MBL fold metallo-hydrolase [Spirulina sp. CS-785/01]
MTQRRPIFADVQSPIACFPYGVGQEGDGMCLLVKMGKYRILLDCGLSDLSPLLAESTPPADLVFCSHAHSDHAKGLLPLHEQFPELPIYGSEATAKLLPLNWPDWPSEADFCQTLPWRSPVAFFDDLHAQLFPAGHLPGAAAILLTYTGLDRAYTLLYTGDFFLSNSRLVEGLSLESLRGSSPDVLIVEASYGTARHPRRRQLEKQLMEKIDRAIAQRHSVLLPVPPLGMAQEILMLLRSHHQFTGRDLDIWVADRVATTCNQYLDLLPHLPASVQNFARHQALFWDEQVFPRVRRLPDNDPNAIDQFPCIVLTEKSGQWQQYCQAHPSPWMVLWPEYPGHNHRQEPDLSPLDATVQLDSYLLTEHSDGRNTTQLIHNIRPQHVVFVHGTPAYVVDLTSLEELQNRYQLHSPASGTLVELPIGDRFVQPAAPKDSHYEGEVHEIGQKIEITLPQSIAQTPRWQNFADTGLVEARWQGEELVLRGLSQRELLKQSNAAKLQAELECCGNCLYQRGDRCSNPASPLYGFKVTPEGYCPVFEPQE